MCNRLLQGILSIPILLLMILVCEDREEGKTEEGVTAVGVVSPFEEPPDYFPNSIGSRWVYRNPHRSAEHLLAPEVGIVKLEDDDGITELIEYTIVE